MNKWTLIELYFDTMELHHIPDMDIYMYWSLLVNFEVDNRFFNKTQAALLWQFFFAKKCKTAEIGFFLICPWQVTSIFIK